MNTSKIAKILGAFLLTGAVSGSAFAAETAEGVAVAFDALVGHAKIAAEAAASGDKDGCKSNVKQAKQEYKQLTGAATGKPMQDAITKMSAGKDQCEKDEMNAAAATLKEVYETLAKLRSEASKP